MITSPLATAAPGHTERLKSEELSPFTTGEGQGAPSTLSSLKAVVLGWGHSSQEPGYLTDHDMLQTLKSWRLRAKTKTFSTKGEEAASPPDSLREEQKTKKLRSKGESWGEVLV